MPTTCFLNAKQSHLQSGFTHTLIFYLASPERYLHVLVALFFR